MQQAYSPSLHPHPSQSPLLYRHSRQQDTQARLLLLQHFSNCKQDLLINISLQVTSLRLHSLATSQSPAQQPYSVMRAVML